jgi:ATP-binding cassette subfamily B protein RaxB
MLQTEAAECGLVCLAMVAGYHGYHVDLVTLRHRHSLSLKGANLAELSRLAGRMGLSARPLRLSLDELAHLRLPAVLHWDMNHFVVLESVRGDACVIHDPARGRRSMTLASLSPHFTGVALELSRSEDFQRGDDTGGLDLRVIWRSMRGVKSALAQVLLLSAALQIFALVSPFFIQLVVDQAILSEDQDLLTVLGLGFLLLAVLRVAVRAARSWVLLYFGTSLNLQLVTNLFRHLLRLPTSFFEKRHVGDIVSRFGSMNRIQDTLTSQLVAALLDGVMAVATLAMMLVYDVRLGLLVVGVVLFYGLLRWSMFRPLREATEEKIVRKAQEDSNFLETVRGARAVKIFNAESGRQAAWQNRVVDRFNASIRLGRLSIIYSALNGVLFGAANIAVIWIGAKAVLAGGFSVGMLYAFLSYKSQFTDRAGSLIEHWVDLRMLDLHLNRVGDIALSEEEPDLDRGQGGTAIEGRLSVCGVSFRYAQGEPRVLDGVEFEVSPGESVALVGPSGCGKTTLLKIMLGLLLPEEGEVRVDGTNIRALGMKRFRAGIGAVMQDDRLFAGSIAENISFFDEQPDIARIEEAARLAAVHADIQAMPMTYDTLVGDMGTVLSGGQQQRVLLARALYRRPGILFLDEATSHLDAGREAEVNAAIAGLDITRVIIAHRQSTIRSADRVVDLGHSRAGVSGLTLA